MNKLLCNVVKQSLQFIFITFCVYAIYRSLEDLNYLVFHSYKTSKVFWPFDNRHFLDLDLIVNYAEHFWEIVVRVLLVITCSLGAVIPYITELYSRLKTRFTSEKPNGDTEE